MPVSSSSNLTSCSRCSASGWCTSRRRSCSSRSWPPGAVFGVDGVVLAAPLAAVAFVLVRELYVRGTLDKRIQVPGEDRR